MCFRLPSTAFSPKTTKASLRQDLADESADRHLPRIPLLDLVEQQRGRRKAAVTLGERFYWCFFIAKISYFFLWVWRLLSE